MRKNLEKSPRLNMKMMERLEKIDGEKFRVEKQGIFFQKFFDFILSRKLWTRSCQDFSFFRYFIFSQKKISLLIFEKFKTLFDVLI